MEGGIKGKEGRGIWGERDIVTAYACGIKKTTMAKQVQLHDIKQKLNCLSVGFRMGFHTLSKRMPNSCSIGA